MEHPSSKQTPEQRRRRMKLVTRDGKLVADPEDEALREPRAGFMSLSKMAGSIAALSSFRNPKQQRPVRKELFGRSCCEDADEDLRSSALTRSPAPRIPRMSHSWMAGNRHLDALASPASIRTSNWINAAIFWAPAVVLCVGGLTAVAIWTLSGPDIVAKADLSQQTSRPDGKPVQAGPAALTPMRPALSNPLPAPLQAPTSAGVQAYAQ